MTTTALVSSPQMAGLANSARCAGVRLHALKSPATRSRVQPPNTQRVFSKVRSSTGTNSSGGSMVMRTYSSTPQGPALPRKTGSGLAPAELDRTTACGAAAACGGWLLLSVNQPRSTNCSRHSRPKGLATMLLERSQRRDSGVNSPGLPSLRFRLAMQCGHATYSRAARSLATFLPENGAIRKGNIEQVSVHY